MEACDVRKELNESCPKPPGFSNDILSLARIKFNFLALELSYREVFKLAADICDARVFTLGVDYGY